jgi:hypothetical protein
MRSAIVSGGISPTTNCHHTGKLCKLSDPHGDDPLIPTTSL